jgi:hypothetical protein
MMLNIDGCTSGPDGCYNRHMRKIWHATKRFMSVSWLVAAPLVIVIAIVALGLVLWLTSQIVGSLFGPEAADAYLYEFAMVLGMLFWVAVIGVPIYAIVSSIKSRRKTVAKDSDKLS